MPRSANQLTTEILSFLHTAGCFAWRASSTGIPSPHGLRTSPKKGVSDILAISPPTGRLLAIEVKIGSDRLSSEQRGFGKNIEHYGGVFYVAKDFDSFKEWFDKTEM